MARKNIIADSQILNTLQACGYKLDKTFNQNLVPAVKATPLEEGDLMHQCFEFYNLGLKEHGTAILYDDEKFEEHVKKSIEYGESKVPNMGLGVAEASEVIFQFDKYVRHTRMDGVKILEVERAFVIELYKDDELGLFYSGKIDRLTDTPDHGIVPRDYKKAKRTEAPSSTSNQFTGYAMATWPEGKHQHTVLVDKVGFQKTLTPEDRFRTYPLVYSRAMIERWKEETIWWLKLYALYLETNTWPRNRTSCDKYGGCIFLKHCEAMDDETADSILKQDFIVGPPWDPTLHLRKES